MKNLIPKKLLAILIVSLVFVWLGSVPAEMQGVCPGNSGDFVWQCGTVVKYKFDSSIPFSTDPSSQMQQINAAFEHLER